MYFATRIRQTYQEECADNELNFVHKNEIVDNLGSLDFLYQFLIKEVFAEKRFFDFGISNESQGKKLNNGLSYWKESFGASTIVQDFYEVKTTNYNLLDTVLI